MKRTFIILFFLVLFSACGEQSKKVPEVSETPEVSAIPEAYLNIPLPERRQFDMAISPVFVLEDIEERYEGLMRELASVTDVYFIQQEVIWDFEEGVDIKSRDYERSCLSFLETTKQLGFTHGYVGISVLNEGRDSILKNPFSDTFSDKRVRRACRNMVLRILEDFSPKYLCFGVEVSAYYQQDPDDFEHFVSLYNEIYSLTKDASPETVVFTTVHYEEFLGVLPWHPHEPHWGLIQKLKMDAFALTTYPYMVYSVEDIPKDYYTQIRSHTNLPVIIAESGFASECCGKTIKDMHGSEEAQIDFLVFVLDSIEEMDPLLWVYWSLYDYEPLSWGGTDKVDIFNSIGLHYPDGTAKPAFYLWVRIFKLPVL